MALGSMLWAASAVRLPNGIISKGPISIGTTATPDPSALVDMISTTKGLGIPSMTTTQRDAISSPRTGLMIYNSTTSKVNQYNGASWVEVGSGGGGLFSVSQNLLTNSTWDTDTSGWTASGGTYTRDTTTANLIEPGNGVGSWDSNSAGQTLISNTKTLASGDGLYSQNGVFSCMFKCASGNCTHTIDVYDTTTSASLGGPTTITSSTTGYVRTTVNFTFPSATDTVEARISSVASNEPTLTIGNCFWGNAETFNVSTVSQAQEYGTLTYAGVSSCSWTNSDASGGFVELGANSSCNAPTVTGNAAAPSTKIPAIHFNTLPPGKYLVMIQMNAIPQNTTTANHTYMISDGTTREGMLQITMTASTNTDPRANTLIGSFSYSTPQTNIEFRPVAKSSTASDDPTIDASDATFTQFQIKVYYFPTTPQTAYNASQLPASWSGYHDSTCSWARTNSSYGDPATDGSCALVERTNRNFGTVTGSNNLPSITFTPNRAGRYFVCANSEATCATSTDHCATRLWDGTTVIGEGEFRASAANAGASTPICGIYNAASTSAVTLSLQTKSTSGAMTINALDGVAAVDWSVTSLDQAMPAPALVNSVTSNASGVERSEWALAVCSTSASITSQSGSWISSIGNISSGCCTITIASGEFSATPVCVANFKNASSSSTVVSNSATSSTSLTVCSSVGGTTTYNANIICRGAH